MIRILVIDDHPVVREGLVAVLEDQPDFAVAGAAGSAEAGVAMAARLQPDVVLLDLELPGLDGVAALPALREAAPAAAPLVFTAYDNEERVAGALGAGARGYLLKGAAAAVIAAAIRTVHAGGTYLAPGVAAKALAGARAPRLTPREREVLQHVAAGLPNKAIARELGITERTVKYHLGSIYARLGAGDRAQAVALALQRGLLG
jgi:DNA-binding NarL/FixJ family response regulator